MPSNALPVGDAPAASTEDSARKRFKKERERAFLRRASTSHTAAPGWKRASDSTVACKSARRAHASRADRPSPRVSARWPPRRTRGALGSAPFVREVPSVRLARGRHPRGGAACAAGVECRMSPVHQEASNEQLQLTRRARVGPRMRGAARAVFTVGRLAADPQCYATFRDPVGEATKRTRRPRRTSMSIRASLLNSSILPRSRSLTRG